MHPTPNLVTPPKIQNAVQDPGQPPHPSTNPFCATPPLQVCSATRVQRGNLMSTTTLSKCGGETPHTCQIKYQYLRCGHCETGPQVERPRTRDLVDEVVILVIFLHIGDRDSCRHTAATHRHTRRGGSRTDEEHDRNTASDTHKAGPH